MTEHSDIDHVSGRSTTGHEWDGIKELNTPLPLVADHLLLDHRLGDRLLDRVSGVAAAVEPYDRDLELLDARRGRRRTRQSGKDPRRQDGGARAAPLAEIERIRPCWRWPAPAARRCSATIARLPRQRRRRRQGYPNLNDDEWLWGGGLDQIMQTIQFGARSGHPKAHESAMLAFGKEGPQERPDRDRRQLRPVAVGPADGRGL